MRFSSSRFASNVYQSRKCILSLMIGILFGFTLAYLLQLAVVWEKTQSFTKAWFSRSCSGFYGGPLYPLLHDNLMKITGQKASPSQEPDEVNEIGDSEMEVNVARSIRVLCWVMTGPENHDTKAQHVKQTWGKRCNVLLFMSTEEDPDLPTIALNVSEGREFLWGKTKAAFTEVYNHHMDSAEWFMKADDDTYVIMENLRYMLMSHNPDDPIYFGCRFKQYSRQGYMSGGAGYVLSREAVKRLVERALPDPVICKAGSIGTEDAELGNCLQNVGVKAGDSRDDQGRLRFSPFIPGIHIMSNYTPEWFNDFSYYRYKEGWECCSDRAISFHYVTDHMMFDYEFFIYHLRPFGLNKLLPNDDESISMEFIDSSSSFDSQKSLDPS